MSKVAIIGTGIAGMGCAHFLHRHFDLTLFEQNAYVGGHTNTLTTPESGTGRVLAIDSGFMVFNHVTYPRLTRLFAEQGVPTKRTDMSFSVRDDTSGLEYCGSSLNHLFAQRRNLFRPRFYRMLGAIDRFNREAVAALGDPATGQETLAEYVRRRAYGQDFLDLYLVPMSSAVWSTPPAEMLQFPATTLLRFFHNHGFLGLSTQHPWWTVIGGSQAYVQKISPPWRDRIRLGTPVRSLRREGGGVVVESTAGREVFAKVIVATHGDQALQLLADPTAGESRLLREFRTQANAATLHTDESIMPRTRLAWSSWNYQLSPAPGGGVANATHYWMNRLQGVSERENYFVTINCPEAIAPAKVRQRLTYRHPLFSLGAVQAQAGIPALHLEAARSTQTFFAGAWQRYGFHEDGLWSAERLCAELLGRDPWGPAAA